jgi:NitT/TauT family transport system permease protein
MSAAWSNRKDPWVRALSLLALVLIWQILATTLDRPDESAPSLLPYPWAVLQSFYYHLTEEGLLYQLGITLARVAASFAVAMAIGCAVGILMGRSKRVDLALDGLLILALNIPALVTIILCYIWLGLTDVAAVVAVAANKIPNVVVTLREGARAVDRKLLEVGQAFAVSRWRSATWIYLPQLYPFLMAAARSGLALIWKIVLVVEFLGRSNGVGFQLHTFFQFFDIASILAYTLAFAAVVLIIEGCLMRPLERRLLGWRG